MNDYSTIVSAIKSDYRSLDEKSILSVLESFFSGLVKKEINLLEDSLAEGAKVELLEKKGLSLNKKDYITRLISRRSYRYRGDAKFMNIAIELFDKWAMAKGKLVFANRSSFSRALWIKLEQKKNRWRISRIMYP